MIVANGYIRVFNPVSLSANLPMRLTDVGGGCDENGDPIPVEETLGVKIPCNFQRSNYQKRGVYDNGVFTAASYIILIEEQLFSPCVMHLYDSRDTFLGKFEVHEGGITHLYAVDNIQIVV